MQHVVAVADAALVPVVGLELERQQRLLLHGAARGCCVPQREARWKNSACLSGLSKLRGGPLSAFLISVCLYYYDDDE